MLQELIGIQRGKGEKNIWFGRLEGSRLTKTGYIRPIFSDNEEKRKSFGRLQALASVVGASRNSIRCVCVCVFFLARFLFQSSFFSESRLCTRPLFSRFVTNLDRLAGQPIQIFLRSRFRIKIFYVFPRGVNPVGDNCMMTKASSRRGRQCNGGILGLCWIDDGHCPPLSLLSSSSFGVLVAFVTTGGIVALWCHHCHC